MPGLASLVPKLLTFSVVFCALAVAGCARDHPDAFLGFASVDPWKGDAAVVELERSVRDLGLRGLKLHPTGIEPITYSSVDCRSIQLSYGCFC